MFLAMPGGRRHIVEKDSCRPVLVLDFLEFATLVEFDFRFIPIPVSDLLSYLAEALSLKWSFVG